MNPETLKLMKEACAKALDANRNAPNWFEYDAAVQNFRAQCSPASVAALIAEYERLRLGVEVALRNAQLLDRVRLWSKCPDGHPLDEHVNNIATNRERLKDENERLKKGSI